MISASARPARRVFIMFEYFDKEAHGPKGPTYQDPTVRFVPRVELSCDNNLSLEIVNRVSAKDTDTSQKTADQRQLETSCRELGEQTWSKTRLETT